MVPDYVSPLYIAASSMMIVWLLLQITVYTRRRRIHPLSKQVPWAVIIASLIYEVDMIDNLIAFVWSNHPWYIRKIHTLTHRCEKNNN